MNDGPPFHDEDKRPWFEPATAILMALASLATAWCSYQSSRWSGQSGALDTHADKLERAALVMHLEAQQIEDVHSRLVMEMVDAKLEGDEKRAQFYVDRFAAELKPAYEKWIALRPFEDPSAPPHPFVPALYTPRHEQEIRDAHAEAARAQAQSSAMGNHASSYLSNTVLLASVLFFAGTMGKFKQPHVRWGSFAFAIALFSYALFRMVTLPIG